MHSLYQPSSLRKVEGNTTGCTETIKELLKDGGWGGAGTIRSTKSSKEFKVNAKKTDSQYALDMFRASLTPQTDHLEANTHPEVSYYPPFQFHMSLRSLSSTLTNQPVSANIAESKSMNIMEKKMILGRTKHETNLNIQLKMQAGNSGPSRSTGKAHRRFHSVTAIKEDKQTSRKPKPYPIGLELISSPLRPHVLAKNCLRLWRPLAGSCCEPDRILKSTTTEEDVRRVFEVLNEAWAESTKETYGTGLLIFHAFCDFRHITESERAPVSHSVLEAFVAAIAGAYSKSAIENFLAGI